MNRPDPDPRADELPPADAVRGQFDLAGCVALVTGAASGLGRAIAWGLACHGADLVIADLDHGAAERMARQVRGLGRRAMAIGVDVSDESQVEAMVERASGEYGHIDIGVNNAGNNCRKPILDMSAAEFDRVVDVHLRGTFLCARAVGRGMVARRRGKIINLASIMAHVGGPAIGPYSAAKGGILQLTKVLALEWAPHNVQVNALSPAHFDTPLTRQLAPEMRAAVVQNNPQGRFAFPAEIIGAAVLLASPASSFITGTSILVDGGWTAR
jgi:NAD(P)-dependent dehydrogenase (short-subunit alcohol dehydrogenase family)